MSLTHADTPVSQQDLHEFYNRLKPYIGIYPSAIANKFSKGDLYSTDEKLIGQWVDGKPLYKKTFTGQKTVADGNVYDCTSLNIETVVKIEGMFAGGWDNNTYFDDASERYICTRYAQGYIQTKCPSAWVNIKIDATIYYTKTTDSTISIGDETDYSTTEKVVGTWIDGSPVYQMSYVATFTDKPAGQRFYIKLADLTNVDYVNANGMIKFNETGEIYSVCTYATDKFSGVSDSNSAYSVWNADGSSHGVVVKQNFYNGNASGTVKVTIQYTKTA